MTLECVTFRESYEPGCGAEHCRRCVSCRAYVSAVEAARAAGSRRSLPPSLERRLLALPHADRQPDSVRPTLSPAVPKLPLPPTLEARLRRIGRQKRPPLWLRSPAASLAASLLFTVMVSSWVENPSDGLKRLADVLEERIESVPEPTLPHWQPERLRDVLAPTEARWHRTMDGARRTLSEWARRLEGALPETLPNKPPEN